MGVSSLSFMLVRFTCNSHGLGGRFAGAGHVSRQGILESRAAWVLTPHSGLLGTLPDLHIARVCILQVG